MSESKSITPGHKVVAVFVMCLFAAPNLYYAATGGEDFPFTCAPMFGHYVGKETRFYNFKFIGEFDGTEKVLPPLLGKINEIGSMRFFFSKSYGSADEWSPFGNHLSDSPPKLEERLSKFFRAYLRVLPETEGIDRTKLKRLRLEVWRYDKNDTVDAKHVVGYYSPSSERFTHTWRKQ